MVLYPHACGHPCCHASLQSGHVRTGALCFRPAGHTTLPPPVTNVPKSGLHRDATIRTILACVPDPPSVPLVLSPPLFISVASIRTLGFVMVCTCLVHGLPMASPPLRAVLTGLGEGGRRSEATSPPNRPPFLFSTMPCHVHHTWDASRPLFVRRSSLISPPCWRSPFDLRSCHEPYLRTTVCCVCPRPIREAS